MPYIINLLLKAINEAIETISQLVNMLKTLASSVPIIDTTTLNNLKRIFVQTSLQNKCPQCLSRITGYDICIAKSRHTCNTPKPLKSRTTPKKPAKTTKKHANKPTEKHVKKHTKTINKNTVKMQYSNTLVNNCIYFTGIYISDCEAQKVNIMNAANYGIAYITLSS